MRAQVNHIEILHAGYGHKKVTIDLFNLDTAESESYTKTITDMPLIDAYNSDEEDEAFENARETLVDRVTNYEFEELIF